MHIKAKNGVFFITLFIMALFYIPSISNANPVPVEGPFLSSTITPLNQTAIYLKSEVISANISTVINEKAEYTLRNIESKEVNLSIALPFDSMGVYTIDYLQLIINGTSSPYTWSTIHFINLNNHEVTYRAIVFNVSFGPFEEILIVANYSREIGYAVDDDFSYIYLTETGLFWNKSIEHAQFNYRLNKTIGRISITGLDNYSQYTDGDFLVVSQEFTNWTPQENIRIHFDVPGVPGFELYLTLITITAVGILLSLIKRDKFKIRMRN